MIGLQPRKTPLNLFFSILLTAFIIFIIYDLAFCGGRTATIVLALIEKYFFKFVDILQAFSDKYLAPFRFIP